jgi:hypothetical protein
MDSVLSLTPHIALKLHKTATDIRRSQGYINPPGTSGLLAFELEVGHDGIDTIERRPR